MTRSAKRIVITSAACLAALVSMSMYAQSTAPIAPAPHSPAISAPTATQGRSGHAAAPKPPTKPLWIDLAPDQQQALKPLESEWDTLEVIRKTKWLAISNKYMSMTPDEQQRLQERMREWVRLTPEQRRIARENYARARKLNPTQKSRQWEQYQQLSEDQKKKLASTAPKKSVTTIPVPSQTKAKTVQPIKSTPKPILERSVTPLVTNQSSIQPAPQSTTTK
jgi:hypothetical protein